MKKLWLIFGMVLLIFASCEDQKKNTITVIDKAEMNAQVIGRDVQLIDVRTPSEYNDGHIDDAVNMNIKELTVFTEEIKDLDKDRPVYLYCKMGGRSNRAAELLKSEGFTKVFDYSGGYSDWVSE